MFFTQLVRAEVGQAMGLIHVNDVNDVVDPVGCVRKLWMVSIY